MSLEELAQQMYIAFAASAQFKNYQGPPMPEWINLTPRIRSAWVAAASKGYRVFVARMNDKVISAIESTKTPMGDQDPIWNKVYEALTEF